MRFVLRKFCCSSMPARLSHSGAGKRFYEERIQRHCNRKFAALPKGKRAGNSGATFSWGRLRIEIGGMFK